MWFYVQWYLFKFADMNECTNNPCGANSQCQDTIGSYTCTCDNGFTGTGFGDCQSMLIIVSIL